MINLFHRFANKNKIILFVRNHTFLLLILTSYQLSYCFLSLQRKVYTLNLENYSSKYSSFKRNTTVYLSIVSVPKILGFAIEYILITQIVSLLTYWHFAFIIFILVFR